MIGTFKALSSLRVEKKPDGVAEVVLVRGDKLNPMTQKFFEEIGSVFRQLDEDPQVNVVLLWAEGRLFTCGLDLKEASFLSENGESSAVQAVQLYQRVKQLQDHFSAIARCKKPVIAAVHNMCIGGGVDLITACDIRLCTEDSRFVIAETRVGIVADLGTFQRISRIVGSGIAREMAFVSEPIDAKRALRAGLVNEVFPNKEELLAKAREMASKIASHSPLVVQGAKTVLNFSEEHSTEEGLQYVALWNSAFLKSDDLMEAVMAFMQKRKPVFKNRL